MSSIGGNYSQAEFEVVHTQRMRPLAIHKGFHYRKYRINKEDVVIWVCVRERSSKCHGRMKTKGNEVIHVTDHVCRMNEIGPTRVRKLSKGRDGKVTNAGGRQFTSLNSVRADLSLEPSALVEVSLADNDGVNSSTADGNSLDSNKCTVVWVFKFVFILCFKVCILLSLRTCWKALANDWR